MVAPRLRGEGVAPHRPALAEVGMDEGIAGTGCKFESATISSWYVLGTASSGFSQRPGPDGQPEIRRRLESHFGQTNFAVILAKRTSRWFWPNELRVFNEPLIERYAQPVRPEPPQPTSYGSTFQAFTSPGPSRARGCRKSKRSPRARRAARPSGANRVTLPCSGAPGQMAR